MILQFTCMRFDPRDPENLLTQLARLERYLDEIRLWLVRNELKLNEDKTEHIIMVGASDDLSTACDLFCEMVIPFWNQETMGGI